MSIAAAACCIAACTNAANDTPKAMQQVDFSHVLIKDAFWSPRLENNAKNTIPVCIDQIENQTGRIRNFEKAAIRRARTQAYSSMIPMYTRLSKAWLTA